MQIQIPQLDTKRKEKNKFLKSVGFHPQLKFDDTDFDL